MRTISIIDFLSIEQSNTWEILVPAYKTIKLKKYRMGCGASTADKDAIKAIPQNISQPLASNQPQTVPE